MKALDALFEANKIAFSPFVFQTVNTMMELGMMDLLFETKEGQTIGQIADKTSISKYGVTVLFEMAECAEIIERDEQDRYTLTKVGFFLVRNPMTLANFHFTNKINYKGLFHLTEAIRDEKPAGLKELGEWKTIYEGLSSLKEEDKKAWFEFDHHYSDNSFGEALKIIFRQHPKQIFDIGGNTGKWTIASTSHDENVKVTIFDLPQQIKIAKANIEDNHPNLASRVNYQPVNLLDPSSEIPGGADVYWMSQFLDCFSEEEIEAILLKIKKHASTDATVFIMETFIDDQRFPAAKYSLVATSLYFTVMANGNSKMYASSVFKYILAKAGFEIVKSHQLHENSFHTILECKIKS